MQQNPRGLTIMRRSIIVIGLLVLSAVVVWQINRVVTEDDWRQEEWPKRRLERKLDLAVWLSRNADVDDIFKYLRGLRHPGAVGAGRKRGLAYYDRLWGILFDCLLSGG